MSDHTPSAHTPSAAAPADETKASHHRTRRTFSIVLLVVAIILTPLSVIANWTRAQLLNESRYLATVEPLASDPAIIEQISLDVTNSLFDAVDVKTKVTDALPESAAFLATSLDKTLRGFVQGEVKKFLETDKFKELWRNANIRAHKSLENLLTGEGGKRIKLVNGRVVLDIGPVIAQARSFLSEKGIGIFDAIPADRLSGQLELFKAENLEKAQKGTKLLDTVANVLPFLALALYGASVLLAVNRRRRLAACGVAIALSVAVLGILLMLGRYFYLDAVTSPQLPRDVAKAVYDIAVKQVRTAIRAVFVFGLLVAFGAWLAGPAKGARRIRGAFTARERVETEPSAFGHFVDEHRVGLRVTAASLGLGVLLMLGQVTPGIVLVVGALVAAAFVAIELLRVRTRPPTTDVASSA